MTSSYEFSQPMNFSASELFSSLSYVKSLEYFHVTPVRRNIENQYANKRKHRSTEIIQIIQVKRKIK